jgi:hypothetical protein
MMAISPWRLALTALVLTLLVSSGAHAQVEDVQPPHPTSGDYIVLRVRTATGEMPLHSLVVSGSTIELTFRGGGELPSTGTEFVPLGRLPAGTYSVVVTFEFTFGGDEVEHIVTLPPFVLVIAPGAVPVPILDHYTLIALVFGIAIVAVITLSHR